jgi:hypothetical protein
MHSPFWTGRTGKAITAAGKDARISATYVLTNEHANMLGLYRLPLLYFAEETGLKRREVAAALEQLKQLNFAYYDEETEFIWVLEMARFQLGLLPGETLKEGDKRMKGAVRLYKQVPSNPFLGPFYNRYFHTLGLPVRRDFLSEMNPHGSPFEGALEPLARGYGPDPDPVSDPVSDRKGDAGETITQRHSPNGLTAEKEIGKVSNGHLASAQQRLNRGSTAVQLNGQGPRFDIFWAAYPKKEGKGACRRWWKEHKPDDELLGCMLATIEQAKQTVKWKEQGGKFIPMPATWLNQERWDDEYMPAVKQKERIPL